ncbi:hypothetical protein DNI29_17835 [Hymenobacter sediminis]|uniref:hypothetical protein n=1 Tax=Hymenobacter sediminis TaxID=2218621 RepID=UPI000DA66E22|nr:hypothetical protein [Hymenobacter sediminis]RPD45253.1 hypothetical protein DNI29_17835 [Hymenobacter sediminis]
MNRLAPLFALLSVAACTSTNSASTTAPASAEPTSATNAAATTEAQATALASRYFRTQPDSAVYQLQTMTVVDAGTSWQVLVKRSDRVGIKPDNAAVNVDKQTGQVTRVLVK